LKFLLTRANTQRLMALAASKWRYILEPVDGGTKVTEQFDYNGSKSIFILKLRGSMKSNEKAMTKTLENIEQHFAA